MVITEEIVKAIIGLNASLKDENSNIDSFATLLRAKAEELGINYNILLSLTMNRDFLFENVYDQVYDLEKEIAMKQKELAELRKSKYLLGSLVCELHGHNYDWEAFNDEKVCVNCGEKHYVKGTDANRYLGKVNKLTSPLYKKDK